MTRSLLTLIAVILALSLAPPAESQQTELVEVTFHLTLRGQAPAGERFSLFADEIPPQVPPVNDAGVQFFCGYSSKDDFRIPDTPECEGGGTVYLAKRRVVQGSDVRYSFVREREPFDRGVDDQRFEAGRVTVEGHMTIRASFAYPPVGDDRRTGSDVQQPTAPVSDGTVKKRFVLTLEGDAPANESFLLRYYGLDDPSLSSYATFCGGGQGRCIGGGRAYSRELVLPRGTRMKYVYQRGELDRVVAGGGETFEEGVVTLGSDTTTSATYDFAGTPQLPNAGGGGGNRHSLEERPLGWTVMGTNPPPRCHRASTVYWR